MSFIKRNAIVLVAFLLGLTIGIASQLYSPPTPPKAELVKANYYSSATIQTPVLTNEEAAIKDHSKYCPVTPVEK